MRWMSLAFWLLTSCIWKSARSSNKPAQLYYSRVSFRIRTTVGLTTLCPRIAKISYMSTFCIFSPLHHRTSNTICAVISFIMPIKWMRTCKLSAWSCTAFTAPEHQSDMKTFLTVFSEPGNIYNGFCTRFLHCATSVLLLLNVRTP